MTAPTDTRVPYSMASPDQRHEIDDEQARQIAAEVLAGRLKESSGRWDIAAIVLRSSVPAEVVKAWNTASDRQAGLDIIDKLSELMVAKTTTPATNDKPAFLDLNQIAQGSSLSAWMRSFGRTALPRVAGAVMHQRKAAVLFDMTESTDGDQNAAVRVALAGGQEDFTSDVDGHVDSGVDAETARASLESVMAAFAVRSHNLREHSRVHIAAKALCEGLRLPRPHRVQDQRTRRDLLAILTDDAKAARRSVTTMIDSTTDDEATVTTRQALASATDAELSAIWCHYQPTDLHRLSTADPRVAHALAAAAVAPAPRPQQRIVRAVRDELVAEARTASQRAKVRETVHAWADYTSDLDCSEFAGAVAVKSPELIAAERRQWTDTASALAASGFRALGTTPEAIAENISARAERVEDRFAMALADHHGAA